jgi:protein-tyrosine phosphatase
MTYVDLHLHLLPAADDGARDLQESLRFARRMVRDGVSEATVTPHVGIAVGVELATIAERTTELQRALDGVGLPLLLHPGGEVHPSGALALDDAELQAIAHGPAGRRWLLLEVPFSGIDAAFIATCRGLRARGLGLLIAHPERAAGVLDGGLELLGDELAAGALLQVNVCSLRGEHGPWTQRAARTLIRDGYAHVLASDAHPGSREQTLKDGYELARELGLNAAQALALTAHNPRRLLHDGVPTHAGAPARAAA